ncbi:hypothetical protein PUN28_015948 [Cardiocondyla obscurior]|uniref:Uncharacterized protein n=1 Tax=Cardiocondyla obscurior TaxID=286306 RepID=A0AAW2EVI8_9HYME
MYNTQIHLIIITPDIMNVIRPKCRLRIIFAIRRNYKTYFYTEKFSSQTSATEQVVLKKHILAHASEEKKSYQVVRGKPWASLMAGTFCLHAIDVIAPR